MHSCKNQLSQREANTANHNKRRRKGDSAVGHAETLDITGDEDEQPRPADAKRVKKGAGVKQPKAEPDDIDIDGKAGFKLVSAKGFCPEDYKLSEVKLKSVVGLFDNAGAGWGSQANGEFKRGPGGLCKEDCKQFVFPQHLPKCSRGASCTFRHMAEVT